MALPTEFGEETQAVASASFTTRKKRFLQVAEAFRRDPRLWFVIVLILLVVAAIFAPVISPYPPLLYHPSIAEQGPTWAHPLGTDSLGRDQLSRIIYGTRISLSVALATILMGGICGTLLGLLAAYFKGWVDQVLTMVIDAILSFPSLIIALAIVASLGPSVINLAVALAFVRIPIYARIARGQTLQVTAQDYVAAAEASGTNAWQIMLRHVFPNIFSPLLVQATVSISFAIIDESILSFLGLGVQPPTPEWGEMVNEARVFLNTDPWMMLGPALAIVIVVLSLNFLGDAVRDRLDPRMRDTAQLAAPTQLAAPAQKD
jgi:peptide/nickel transport system permease protein